MKEFRYVVRDESGLRHEGTRNAVCQHDVLMWARDNGYVPISVDEAGGVQRKQRRKISIRVTTSDISNFCWQLATMMEGGISITESLDTIVDDMTNARFARVIIGISNGIKGGDALSDCIAEHPDVFDKLFHGLVLAGESSGSMPVVLRRLAEYYEKRDRLIKKVRGALAYPIFVIGFIFVILIIMATFVIPRFRGIFESIGGNMPAFTENFLKVYDFLMDTAVYSVPGLIVLSLVLVGYCKTKTGHEKLGRFTLSLPLFGKIILQAFIALFCRTAAVLLSAGVSVLDCFDVIGATSRNDIIRHSVFIAKENIVKGSSISFSLAAAKLFPNLVIKMTKVGEQTGSLPDVLEKTADYYERKVEATLEMMTKLLEPLLIVVVGAIVLVVVFALYLPIFYLSDVQG